MQWVIKRDGTKEKFDINKIEKALTLAGAEHVDELILFFKTRFVSMKDSEIEVIQDEIERLLIALQPRVHKKYHEYRKERTAIRQSKSDLMCTIGKLGRETDRDNGNVGGNFSAKLLRIASESNKAYNLSKMPKRFSKAHEIGKFHIHDLDSLNLTTNCLHIDLADLLARSFNPGYGTIKQPQRIETAAELACIILQAEQNDQFGGVSYPNFDNDLAPYVVMTREEIYREYVPFKKYMSEMEFNKLIEDKLEKRVRQAMQGVCYNLNTLHSRAGSQVPFSSLNIGLPTSKEAALVTRLLLEEYNKGMGNKEQFIFPNIAFKVKEGINREPNDPLYDLFVLACNVAANRLNPTFLNMDNSANKPFYDKGIIPAVMGCRTAVCSNVNGKEGPARRGNVFPTSINLPRLAILANKDLKTFYTLLNECMEEIEDFTIYRYNVLKQLKGKDLPFAVGQRLMQGSENIGPYDSIEPILKQGTFGLGFIGVAEALTALFGKHHGEDKKAYKEAIHIVTTIHEYCKKMTDKYHLNFSCYATPAEGLSGSFVVKDKKAFGIIPGVTDKNYYTNSYAIPVGFEISSIEKLTLEAPFHSLCTGGHISYIEFDGKPTGETVLKIITKAYRVTDIDYIGINFHKRYCKQCGQDIIPYADICMCGSKDIQGISRITGYLGLDERFGTGKAAERADRISHEGNHNKNYYL